MANYFQILPPLVFSYRLFIFTNRGNFQSRTWVWRKFVAENCVNFQREDWTGVKWSSQSRKINFLTLQILPSASSTRDLGTRLGERERAAWTPRRSTAVKRLSMRERSCGDRIVWFEKLCVFLWIRSKTFFLLQWCSSAMIGRKRN